MIFWIVMSGVLFANKIQQPGVDLFASICTTCKSDYVKINGVCLTYNILQQQMMAHLHVSLATMHVMGVLVQELTVVSIVRGLKF